MIWSIRVLGEGLPAGLISWEIPRLCRGGSRSLTFPAVCALAALCHGKWALAARPLILRKARYFSGGGYRERDEVSSSDRIFREVIVREIVKGWELGPFEGPPILKPPALPGDTYRAAERRKRSSGFWTRFCRYTSSEIRSHAGKVLIFRAMCAESRGWRG
jgi:hypothetical protein